MTFTLHTPATQMDVAACAAAVTHQIWAMAKVQVRLGASFALRNAQGEAVACGGFIYRDEETCDAWFMAAPEARRHMLAVVRAIRLTGIPAPYGRAIAFISTPEGRRIAEMCGYRLVEVQRTGMEVYVYDKNTAKHDGRQQRRGAAGGAAGCCGAKTGAG